MRGRALGNAVATRARLCKVCGCRWASNREEAWGGGGRGCADEKKIPGGGRGKCCTFLDLWSQREDDRPTTKKVTRVANGAGLRKGVWRVSLEIVCHHVLGKTEARVVLQPGVVAKKS